MPANVHPLQWLGARDNDFAALRRAVRASIVMPGAVAFCDQLIGDATTALFAAFGSFAMLVMTDFHGPMFNRLRNQATLVVACCALICLGTFVSQTAWLAAATMAVASARAECRPNVRGRGGYPVCDRARAGSPHSRRTPRRNRSPRWPGQLSRRSHFTP